MSERIGGGESRSNNIIGECLCGENPRTPTEPVKVSAKNGVRQRSAAPAAHQDYLDHAGGPAHPSNRLVAQLNESWRVVDDPLQWILQRRKGSPREKNTGWRDRSFCRTREALLRCVHEYCGDVEPAALAKLAALPSRHVQSQSLEVAEADHDRSQGCTDVAETSNGISKVSDVLRARRDRE